VLLLLLLLLSSLLSAPATGKLRLQTFCKVLNEQTTKPMQKCIARPRAATLRLRCRLHETQCGENSRSSGRPQPLRRRDGRRNELHWPQRQPRSASGARRRNERRRL
jgi:hypothetical protein